MTDYVALIHKDDGSDFGVSFPDFPGCVTAGKTINEARRMAEDALSLHVEGMIAEGLDLPAPSDFDRVMAEAENRAAIACLVPLSARARNLRINVSINERDLKDIDDFARARGLTRSGLLVRAARLAMETGSL